MKVIYINAHYDEFNKSKFKTRLKILEIDDNIQTFYKLLDTESVDIITRSFKNKKVVMIVDGERHLKPANKDKLPIAICKNAKEELFGSMIICGTDGENLTDVPIDISDIEIGYYRIEQYATVKLYEYEV